jgi:para-aminobenzoate synthetase component 1
VPRLPAPFAVFGPGSGHGAMAATDLVEVTDDLDALDRRGRWAVVLPYDGPALCARFATWRPIVPTSWASLAPCAWPGIGLDRWRSSLDEPRFADGVAHIREAIAAGDVYQVNLTRRLSAPLTEPADSAALVAALGRQLAAEHAAPFAATVVLPEHGVAIASASPERFLSRDGTRVWSSPIKGTAASAGEFAAKDRAENVMIVDLVRNDLGRVCEYGSVGVPALFAVEAHPGLVHLVSTVEGRLRAGISWADLLAATFPPGSVTGAPKLAAIAEIARLEPASRGVYCGAVGWVDADRRTADLNVAIRTFWADGDLLHLGTGGAITYDSTPEGEWNETELKARRLLALAACSSERSGSTAPSSTPPRPMSASSTTA